MPKGRLPLQLNQEASNKIMLEDLVLQIPVEDRKWDGSKYREFVRRLCGGREYQEEAIFASLDFLLSKRYENLRELARKNFDFNKKLREHYGTFEKFESCLQLPDILSASLDLATGTGKSYVLYGIAAIMLEEGEVNKVLVLCPSRTIETGLIEKFGQLAASHDLCGAMRDAKNYPPHIMNADSTVIDGAICVENYHAIFSHVRSSIFDSFAGKGADTLVLNDEAHHVASSSSKNQKWKKFLMDPEYRFRRVIGVSGTCYVKDKYFADVISRYSLKRAIDEKFVKNVKYVAEANQEIFGKSRMQKIYAIHCRNKQNWECHGIRPISIIVTADIKSCEKAASELKEFLQKQGALTPEESEDKVLVVTSAPRHKSNLIALKHVDDDGSNVEWILSVSMLSEGWDVKNVFQIVPHEERAFNSKLLISQVLGRGLRIPEKIKNLRPTVVVFNHDAWYESIENLVQEILETEQKVHSFAVAASPYHFNLHNLRYRNTLDVKDYYAKGEHELFSQGYIEVPPEKSKRSVHIIWTDPSGRRSFENENVEIETHTASTIAREMRRGLIAIDDEMFASEEGTKTDYAKRYSIEFLENLIIKSVTRVGIHPDEIVEKVRQAILSSLNNAIRPSADRLSSATKEDETKFISTKDLGSISCSASDLGDGNKKAVFYHSGSVETLPEDEVNFFTLITAPDSAYKRRVSQMDQIKSPVNLVIAGSNPERQFVERLCEKHNSEKIFAWIKNTDSGFYEIEYAWTYGNDTALQRKFNPDFFIKLNDGTILVIEIKGDPECDQPDQQNISKFKFAKAHFKKLNERLEKGRQMNRYKFFMMTPDCYDRFFQCLREGTLDSFVSKLGNVINNRIERDE